MSLKKIFRAFQTISHRGSHAHYPENSLAAFKHALAAGATMIEFDVQLSSDRVLVVHHDETFKRLAGINQKVSSLSSDEISDITLTNPQASIEKEASVVFLEDLFKTFGKSTFYDLELKVFPSTSMISKFLLCDLVAKMIDFYDLSNHVLVTCFQMDVLEYLRATYPSIYLGLNYDSKHAINKPIDFLTQAVDVLCPKESLLTRRSVKHLILDNGMTVVPWGATTLERMKELLSYPIKGLTVDDIPMLRKALNQTLVS